MELPPGFRFHPTDEEIITSYLSQKVADNSFSAAAIGEVDLNKNEPWDLPGKARMGERVWYFFCQRDRKYPTGMRTNRATEAGYWKATGKDKEIYRGRGLLVGMKKTLVFYTGRAPRGQKTNWVMHEFRLEGDSSSAIFSAIPNSAKDEWVVCRVFHKNAGIKRSPPSTMSEMVASAAEDFVDYSVTLPPLVHPPRTSPIIRNSAGFLSSDQSFNLEAISGAATMSGMDELILHPGTVAVFDPQAHVVPLANANSASGGSANLGFLHQQDRDILEALSSANTNHANNQEFCPPQDTGHLIIDRQTAEISSIVLPKQYGAGDLVDSPASPAPGTRVWDYMWKL